MSHLPLNSGLSRKSIEIAAWFQRTTNRKWPMGCHVADDVTARDVI